MGIVNEAAPPETPPKGSHPQVSKGQTPHQNAVSQAVKPPPIAKGGNSKDDLDIDKLQRDFQNIKREMSSDVKSEGSGPLPLTVYDPTLGDAKQMRQVMDVTQVPKLTQANNELGSFQPISGPSLHHIPPIQTIHHASLVAEPEAIVPSIPARTPRRPSMSQQMPPRPHDNFVPSETQQRQMSRQNFPVATVQNVESYEALRSNLQIAQYEKQNLQRELDKMTQLANEQGEAIASLERSREDMASELDNARNSCERSREHAAKLGNDVAQAQEDLLDWQGRFGLVNNELLQLRSNLDKHVSDKWFQSQWKVLHTRIEAVSDQYFVGRQSRFQGSILSRGKGMRPDKLEIHPSISLTRLTNEHACYLGSEHMRPFIIQAFIWWVLVNRIFAHMACDEWGFFWAGQSRDLLYHLKRQILPPRPRDWPQSDPVTLQRMEADARNYHTWRATTAMLLVARTSVDKRIKTVQDLIIDLVGDVLQAVSPYIVLPKGTSPGAAEDGFCKQLEAIFVEAIKTDAEMAQQRAWIYCEQWRAHREGDPLWGFACSPDEAEIIQTVDQSKGRRAQATGSCIELIVQPALLRDGNQYGEKYATQQVLCKAKVIAGETTLQCFQHR